MNSLHLSMEEELNAIDENNQIHKSLKAINICQEYFGKLKKHIEENPFKTIEEEIYFFKSIKPKFQSKLFFYLKWGEGYSGLVGYTPVSTFAIFTALYEPFFKGYFSPFTP